MDASTECADPKRLRSGGPDPAGASVVRARQHCQKRLARLMVALIQVKSKEEAIEWVKRWPALGGDGEVELEIRQVFEAEDFGPAFTSELREAEDRMRAQVAAER